MLHSVVVGGVDGWLSFLDIVTDMAGTKVTTDIKLRSRTRIESM
jgi:hypothetical protein